MAQTAAVPPMVNQTMKFILRSPLHGMVSKTTCLVTFTGRSSGKTYTTPVSYSHHGEEVRLFTHAEWWKNLRSGASVTLRLQGRDFQGRAEPVALDKTAIAAGLAAHLRQVPSNARWYHVKLDAQGSPDEADVAQAVQTVVMICVRLC